jgi:hypothetical protein
MAIIGLLLGGSSTAPATAQVTGTPAFHAPYRPFANHEFGATASFLESSQTAFEGSYRMGVGPLDVGARLGGVVRKDASDAVLAGLDVRIPVLFHQAGSPLDGAIITGIGAAAGGGVGWWVPLGLSLARRLNLEGSDVSLVPYIEPAGFFTTSGTSAVDLGAGVGFGLDLRLTRTFEIRVSAGVGSTFAPRGVAVTAAWLR